MVRVRKQNEAVSGVASLSNINDPNVKSFVEEAFQEQSIRRKERQDKSKSPEYAIIWDEMESRAKFADAEDEVIERLIDDPEEIVLVGIENAHYAGNYGSMLARRLKASKYSEVDMKLSVRLVAEKDPTSTDKSGTLLAVRKSLNKK